MDNFLTKSKDGKRYSVNNKEQTSNKIQNIKQQLQQLAKSMHSSKKNKQDDKSFVFSLSNFQDKNKSNKNIVLKNEDKVVKTSETSILGEIDKQDYDKQSKRKKIYGSESFKQKYEEEFHKSAQSNNNLFKMIFLNQNKQQQNLDNSQKNINISNITTSDVSFVKAKSSLKIQPKFSKEYQNQLNINDFYLGKKLGSGKFGEVFMARHKTTGFICAIKKIQKKQVDSRLIIQLLRQIKIQSFLNHPNIVKMYTFFADKNSIYLVIQICYSGQLYNFLKKKRKLPEETTRFLVQQICRAIDYMHVNEIIHRDLKPQNVIYHCGLMKICDFGWSICTNTMRETFCGTPLYVSPQLLKRKTYNNKIDVWSVGILTYELMFGKVPFEITTQQDFVKIIEDEIKFSKATKISDNAQDFILNCLQKDPRDRFTISQLLDHPFLTSQQNVQLADFY